MDKLSDFQQNNLNGALPGAAALKVAYKENLISLSQRYPNLLVVEEIQEFPSLLQTHRLCADDIGNYLQLTPKVYDMVKRKMKFIMVTKAVKEAFPDLLAELPQSCRNAKHLYAVEELNKVLLSMMTVSLQSVKLPLSLFTDHVQNFQHEFKEEVSSLLKTNKKGPAKIVDWKSVRRNIHIDLLHQLDTWHDDVEILRTEQRLDPRQAVKLPSIQVQRPNNILPLLWTYKDVTRRINCKSISAGQRFVINDGWAKFELDGVAYARFTPGPLLGEPKNWIDYSMGATIVVTVPRALSLIGEDSIMNAKYWNWSDGDIFWNGSNFSANKYQQKYPLPKATR